jgi:hypothetical protein
VAASFEGRRSPPHLQLSFDDPKPKSIKTSLNASIQKMQRDEEEDDSNLQQREYAIIEHSDL